MRHFQDNEGQFFGYQVGVQDDLIEAAIQAGWKEVSIADIQRFNESAAHDMPLAHRIDAIKAALQEMDLASVRPLRAIAAGTATQGDHDKLAELEAQAVPLRDELATLEGAADV